MRILERHHHRLRTRQPDEMVHQRGNGIILLPLW